MLLKQYNRFIRRKMFNKILVIYALGIILVLSGFGVYLYNTILTMTEKNEIRYISRTIQDVNKRIDEKYSTFKTLLFQMYLDNYTITDIPGFLESGIDDGSVQGRYIKKNFGAYTSSLLSRDADLYEVTVYRKKDGKFYYYTRSGEGILERSQAKAPWLGDMLSTSGAMTVFTPLAPSVYRPTNNVFLIARNIKKLNSTANTGAFILGFKTDGLESDVSQMTKRINGTILVLLPDGQVVYDSSRQYYGKAYPWLEQIATTRQITDAGDAAFKVGIGTVDGRSMFIFTSDKNSTGMRVIGLVPRQEVTKYADQIRSTIIAIDAICIIMLLVLITINTSALSKRVSTVTSAMKKLRSGDLSVRIPIEPEPDELGEIAASFNKMGDSLKEYIDKAYLFELRRKSAEYKYLQSQINPHFLYNTLEAIRMKAVTAGDTGAGQMIYTLALLLRSTIKKDAFITVSDELEYCRMYLELMKLRYGDKLEFSVNADKKTLRMGMPRHLLQPIIENSIIHGFDSSRQVRNCSVNACCKDGDMFFEITDDGCGMDADTLERVRNVLAQGGEGDSGSIGLANVNERIRILYGTGYGLELRSALGQGTVISLRLKALSPEEVNLLVQSADR